MKIIGQIINKGRKISTSLLLNQVNAIQTQKRTLKKLLTKAAQTEFGKHNEFSKILKSPSIYHAFSAQVPLSDYSKMHPWWQKAYNGEEHVTWPGKIEYFALSSGTSEGSSKYIPVSQDMLKSIKKAALRQILSIAKTDLPKDFLAKNYLMVGGSTDLYFDGNVYSGDLSGITTQNVPFWFERFSKPSMVVRSNKNWKDKIEQMTLESKDWDVVMVAGVPAWIQLLFENIIKTYNLEHIHEIWPNLSVFVHGGVELTPYKKSFEKLLGKPILYFNTYLASEGFVAFQNKVDAKGMRLVFRNGMFYEFIQFNRSNFSDQGDLLENPVVVPIDRVEENTPYAIVLTTCAGAWRYLIGDVIEFVDVPNCEIKIVGRTKHFLSLCGEHLSVDNMNTALQKVADKTGITLQEFTVKGIPYENFFAHQWFIGMKQSDQDSIHIEDFTRLLDKTLCEINDDYATERKHALKNILVTLLPNQVFLDWMEKEGKLGSQNKFPRVLSDSKYVSWKNFVESYQKSE